MIVKINNVHTLFLKTNLYVSYIQINHLGMFSLNKCNINVFLIYLYLKTEM